LENNPHMDMIRQELAKAVGELIDRAKRQYKIKVHEKRFELLERDKKLIADWADLTALLRSPVARDRYHGVKFHPEPEVGTDLAQGFRKISGGLSLLGIYDYERYLGRLACDSIPYSRREIIKKLVTDGKISVTDRKTPSTTYYELEDMRLLGIVELVVDRDWRIKPQLRARIGILAGYF